MGREKEVKEMDFSKLDEIVCTFFKIQHDFLKEILESKQTNLIIPDKLCLARCAMSDLIYGGDSFLMYNPYSNEFIFRNIFGENLIKPNKVSYDFDKFKKLLDRRANNYLAKEVASGVLKNGSELARENGNFIDMCTEQSLKMSYFDFIEEQQFDYLNFSQMFCDEGRKNVFEHLEKSRINPIFLKRAEIVLNNMANHPKVISDESNLVCNYFDACAVHLFYAKPPIGTYSEKSVSLPRVLVN